MNSILTICNDSAYFLRHRRIVADALVAQGATVTVMSGGPPLPPGTNASWTYRRVPIERFSFSPVSDLSLAWRVLREMRHIRPSAIHLITLKPAVIAGLAALLARPMLRPQPRLVITIPGLGRLLSPASELDGPGARTARRLVGSAIRLLSSRREVVFTFETHHDRDVWLADGMVREDNSVVISGAGVDPHAFYPDPGRAEHAALRVLFASRLLKSKGLGVFVETARKLADDPELEFLVAGMIEDHDPDGYSREELANEPAIAFLGEVTDMPALLRGVDLVVLPTLYGEGIPRILIEAAACGVACVASDLDGCREIVVDGETGRLMRTGPREDMARSLEDILGEYRRDRPMLRRHGEAAHALFSNGNFSQQAVVGTFVRLLVEPDDRHNSL